MARQLDRVLRAIAEMPAGQHVSVSLVATAYEMDEACVVEAVRELAASGYVTVGETGEVYGVTPLGRQWVLAHRAHEPHSFLNPT